MENINSAQHEEIKAILENKNPNEFNIEKFIDEVKGVKDKYKKPLTWSHDEWDNWYEGH
jgi:alpha-L-arabinofuranosidase